ncbi:MAG TPA: ABC transporter ATP-binding protein [Gemmatimonadales bacterium]|nr:ABC transporter ATP-binding protein [Gemmatimonadales bacterium]
MPEGEAPAEAAGGNSPPALRLHDLHKRYGPVRAVDGLSLEIRTGECFGLLGPNGAGKTTTIEICEGLTAQDQGTVEVLGLRWDRDATRLRRRIGVSLQETQFSEKLTVRETLSLFRSFYGTGPTVASLLEQVQLAEKRDARVGQLSGGQRQRLALAVGLVGGPELLFLDEPTTGLDPQSRRQLWDLIAGLGAEGRTVLLTTHYMEEAERLCDRVAIVDHGRIIARDTPRALISALGADQVVEFTLEPGSGPGAPPTGLPGVLDVRQEGNVLSFRVTRLHQTLPALLEAVGPRGIVELRTHAPTLEDVFVDLTGRRLRDE